MALPEQYLKKSPEQQKAARRRAMIAYEKAPTPAEGKAAGRAELMREEPEAVLDPPSPQKRLTPQEAGEIANRRATQAQVERFAKMKRGEPVREQ